jgi:hypothetical protein
LVINTWGVTPATVGEDPHVHHALPDRRVREDDEVPLGEVLHHLEVIVVQVELAAKGVAKVIGLRVMAAAVDPAHRSPADELVPTAVDGASCRDGTEGAGRLGLALGLPGYLAAAIASWP